MLRITSIVTVPFSALLALSACGEDPASIDQWNDEHADNAYQLQRTASPCDDASQATLASDTRDDLWCGCGDSSPGLFLLADGDVEFTSVEDMQDASVMDVTVSSDGMLVVAGENADSGEPLLVSTSIESGVSVNEDGLVVMADVWLDLALSREPDIDHDEVSVNSEGQIALTDGLDVSFYDGIAWTPTTDFSEDAGYINNIESMGEIFVASGANSDNQPAVFQVDLAFDTEVRTMTLAEAEGQMHAITRLGTEGQVAVGSTLDGEILVARCDTGSCDTAEDWDMLPPSDEVPSNGNAMDVAFDTAGEVGVMVGSLPSMTDGWASVTTDGGLTWEAVEGDFPPLTECMVDDSGSFVLMGEGSFSVLGSAGA